MFGFVWVFPTVNDGKITFPSHLPGEMHTYGQNAPTKGAILILSQKVIFRWIWTSLSEGTQKKIGATVLPLIPGIVERLTSN